MCTGTWRYVDVCMFLISSGLILFLNAFIMIQPLLFSTCIPLFLVSGIPYLWYVQPLIFADSSQISLQIKIFKNNITWRPIIKSYMYCLNLDFCFFIFNTFLISTFKSENCCWIFGLSWRYFSNSSFSFSSLLSLRLSSILLSISSYIASASSSSLSYGSFAHKLPP